MPKEKPGDDKRWSLVLSQRV